MSFLSHSIARRALRSLAMAALFGAGYLLGATAQPSAEAQMGELGKKAMESAGGGGLGSVTDLGKSILEMREHVNGLNENLDRLEKIKAALGGG